MKKKLYTITQWTWGLPQTLIGSAVFMIHRKDRHYDYNGAHVTEWERDDGVSLGKFIFVPKDRRSLIRHEYGHTIQSLILGPAYLLMVGLPSIMWNRLPYFREKRRRTGRSYYSAVFESTANKLGERADKKAKGQK
jgi:hypothetical protein